MCYSSGEIVDGLEMRQTTQDASGHPSARGVGGRAALVNNMLGLVERVAPSEATVLLLGESGTGKELVAKAVHNASKRAKEPFVAVDCSGITVKGGRNRVCSIGGITGEAKG